MRIRQANTGPEFVGTAIGQVATWDGQQWVASPAPYDVVTRVEDLPAPVSGVITLETGSGPWFFKNVVDVTQSGQQYQLVQEEGVAVWCAGWANGVGGIGYNGGWITNRADAGHINRNYYNHQPFFTQNLGGVALELATGSVVPTQYVNWFAVGAGAFSIDKPAGLCPYLNWQGGIPGNVRLVASGGEFDFANCWAGGRVFVAAGSSGRVDGLSIRNWRRLYGAAPGLALVEFEEGTYNLGTTQLSNVLDGDGQLLKLPSTFNAGGVPWNAVQIIGGRCGIPAAIPTNGIEISPGVVPLGCLTVDTVDFFNATPFGNFTAATARVYVRKCTRLGVKLTETAITP